jgi:hypothetical protein
MAAAVATKGEQWQKDLYAAWLPFSDSLEAATPLLVAGQSAVLGGMGSTAAPPSGTTKLSTSGGAASTEPVVSTIKVNWGQQEKHFPGHPNYQPGRSTLTADPELLAERAGTGEAVNKIPPGQAGYKERVDFGYLIGSYASEDGAAAPTTVGLFHYRADGSVHIVPGRPAP